MELYLSPFSEEDLRGVGAEGGRREGEGMRIDSKDVRGYAFGNDVENNFVVNERSLQ
jgi:hypothetical protein